MELNKCPNCSGKLTLGANRKTLVCPYCGSEFEMDTKTKEALDDEPINKDWFLYEWNYKAMKDDSKYKATVSAFVRALNEYHNSAALEKYMKDYLMGFDEISAPGIREEKMKNINARLSGNLDADERVILYYDDGLFIHGKTGMVLTNKNTMYITKKNIKKVPHATVPYLFFEYSMGLPGIKIGDQYENNIGTFSSHYDLQGAVAALICFFSFENNPDRPRLKLTSMI